MYGIIQNYEVLMRLWQECLTEGKTEPEVRMRIRGVLSAMESKKTFFGKAYSHKAAATFSTSYQLPCIKIWIKY